MATTPVFMLQDGAVDELMSVVLALRQPSVDLTAIGIANADCLGDPTLRATRKILHWLGADDVQVGVSGARAVNAFPWEYRPYAMMVDLLPILNRGTPPPDPAETADAEDLLIAAVEACVAAGTKLVVLALCPLTPLVRAWERQPEITDGIGRIVWMGGALAPDPPDPYGFPYGNVDTGLAPGANPNAEWNAFWDPFAVEAVLASGIPLTLFPLNVTNQVTMDSSFILKLAPDSASSPIYDLAGQMYAMVAFQAGYSFWDTVATAYLDQPGLFGTSARTLEVVTTGPDQGTILEAASGTAVTVAETVDKDAFYAYLMQQWAGPVG